MKLCITFRNRSVPFTYRSNWPSSLPVNCYYLSGVASLKIELLSLLSNDLLTIIRDYVGCSLTGNRKQKYMCKISGLKSGRGLLRN